MYLKLDFIILYCKNSYAISFSKKMLSKKVIKNILNKVLWFFKLLLVHHLLVKFINDPIFL